MTEKLLYSVPELAEATGVSETMIRHWIKHEGLPAQPVSIKPDSKRPKLVVSREDFQEWIEGRRRRIEREKDSMDPDLREFAQKILAETA